MYGVYVCRGGISGEIVHIVIPEFIAPGFPMSAGINRTAVTGFFAYIVYFVIFNNVVVRLIFNRKMRGIMNLIAADIYTYAEFILDGRRISPFILTELFKFAVFYIAAGTCQMIPVAASVEKYTAGTQIMNI